MVLEAHGGRISLEDVEGWAASFVVQLPAESPR
jgi:signal transduction histidine kinase